MKCIPLILCVGMLVTISSMQANIVSDTVGKAKQTAKSAWNKTKRTWNKLDDSTKNAIKAGGAAIGATVATYGAYQYANNNETEYANNAAISGQKPLRTADEVRAGLPQSPEMKAQLDSYAPTVPIRSQGAYQERLQKYEQWEKQQAGQL